uniref:Uncharacterized protein n=1 Tax=Arundo donax TaxID=35708 RepID=A0A0A8YIW6_ARUDO
MIIPCALDSPKNLSLQRDHIVRHPLLKAVITFSPEPNVECEFHHGYHTELPILGLPCHVEVALPCPSSAPADRCRRIAAWRCPAPPYRSLSRVMSIASHSPVCPQEASTCCPTAVPAPAPAPTRGEFATP